MPNKIDILGKKFGELTVISEIRKRNANKKILWKCRCSCGKDKNFVSQSLIHGYATSCGCLTNQKISQIRIIDISGQRFGRLVVLRREDEIYKNRLTSWICICDCGTKKVISKCNLVTGKAQSCGCLFIERVTKHGMSYDRFYRLWLSIKDRITNKNNAKYNFYGGRGIKLKWKSFIDFRRDMFNSYNDHVLKFGIRETSIDRIDNDGDYKKDNCRWATKREQSINRRCVSWFNFRGKKMILKDIALKLNIPFPTLQYQVFKKNILPKGVTIIEINSIKQ